MKSNSQIVELTIPTADGEFIARYSENGLCGLAFPGSPQRRISTLQPVAASPIVRAWHDMTVEALNAALLGHAPKALPPLDLASGTAFQQSVWAALRSIDCGQTLSYAQVAERIGRPKAVRAVGGACGANPIPVLVPCHRVLAANQRLGGFSGGLDWKRKLLARESIKLASD